MEIKRIDYNNISAFYDQRYMCGEPFGIAEALMKLACNSNFHNVLEVGCGTGYWIARLPGYLIRYGLDISMGMLEEARRRDGSIRCVRGIASVLPFRERVFDVVFCIHALHHFEDKPIFISEARRVLLTGGKLGVVGMDPLTEADRWYLYDYFPGTRETDLVRYPPGATIIAWMKEAGYMKCERTIVARIAHDYIGREVLTDPILHKYGTSQLSLLTEDEFSAGMARINEQIQLAEENNSEALFSMNIAISMVTGLAG
jgi:ubiquinone/menaquinone biosynthesis C-methylase UbiE